MRLQQARGAAPPSTVPDPLQRGRRAGWVQVARGAAEPEVLLKSIRTDMRWDAMRWDAQVESREDYAMLALHGKFPAAPVAEPASQPGDEDYAHEILATTAKRGSADAETELTLRPSDTRRWKLALRILHDRRDPVLVPRLEHLVAALARHPVQGPYPELERVYVTAAYSHTRGEAAAAMAATDPGFGSRYAIECLWDCEPDARIVGIRHTPLTGAWRRRIQELAEDKHEEPSVRDAARERLAPTPGEDVTP